MSTAPKLNLIVAACNSRGIGINGQLPWRLRGDMNFFKTVTQTTKHPEKQNAVIMGRKTWESIPEKFRPLQKRLNIVISTTLRNESTDNVIVAKSFEGALDAVSSCEIKDRIENVFIIGGSSVYEMALSHPSCHRIFYTHVMEDFKCDTFLPEFDEKLFKLVEHPDVNGDIQTEKNLRFQFRVYEKIMNSGKLKLRPFDIMGAMSANRGMGKNGRLSWPFLKKDYDYYINLTTHVSKPGKKVAYIKGRITYEGTGTEELSLPNVLHVILSKKLSECPKHVHRVVPDLESALSYLSSQPISEEVEKIWIMGGEQLYKEAIKLPQCNRVYLTKIHQTFEADCFFPHFEDEFRKIRNEQCEENGLGMSFEVYERI